MKTNFVKKHGTFIYLFAAFSVINPIGTVPIFVGLTQDDDKRTFPYFTVTAVNVL
jgi:multiple antibiotic resistance protein